MQIGSNCKSQENGINFSPHLRQLSYTPLHSHLQAVLYYVQCNWDGSTTTLNGAGSAAGQKKIWMILLAAPPGSTIVVWSGISSSGGPRSSTSPSPRFDDWPSAAAMGSPMGQPNLRKGFPNNKSEVVKISVTKKIFRVPQFVLQKIGGVRLLHKTALCAASEREWVRV